MWDAIKTAGKTMLGSKKFIAAVLACATWAAGKIGWNVDDATLAGMISPILAYIVGQGLADSKKLPA
jgi:hypothetical protein